MVLDRPVLEVDQGEEREELVAVGWVILDRVLVLEETVSARTAGLKYRINRENPVPLRPVSNVARQ
jgi:hypothetical protein